MSEKHLSQGRASLNGSSDSRCPSPGRCIFDDCGYFWAEGATGGCALDGSADDPEWLAAHDAFDRRAIIDDPDFIAAMQAEERRIYGDERSYDDIPEPDEYDPCQDCVEEWESGCALNCKLDDPHMGERLSDFIGQQIIKCPECGAFFAFPPDLKCPECEATEVLSPRTSGGAQ